MNKQRFAIIVAFTTAVLGAGMLSACSGDGSDGITPFAQQEVPEFPELEAPGADASSGETGDDQAIDDFNAELDALIDAGLGTDHDWLGDGR